MILDYKNLLSNHTVSAEFISNIVGLLYAQDVYQVSPTEVRDALSSGQLASKIAVCSAIDQMNFNEQRILIVGGWIGTLSRMIFDTTQYVRSITSLDIDPRCKLAAKAVVGPDNRQFDAVTNDMYTFNQYDQYSVVINTSCEHIPDLSQWLSLLNPGTTVILQSNDASNIAGHCNTVDSVEQLEQKAKLTTVLAKYTIPFPMYTRFMLIGVV